MLTLIWSAQTRSQYGAKIRIGAPAVLMQVMCAAGEKSRVASTSRLEASGCASEGC